MSHRIGDVPPGDREMTREDLEEWRAYQARLAAERAARPLGEIEILSLVKPTTLHIGGHAVLVSRTPDGAQFEFIPEQGSQLAIEGDGAGVIVRIAKAA